MPTNDGTLDAELLQIPKPELGRPNDSRLTAEYIALRPELAGVTPFDPRSDVDLVDHMNDALAHLHTRVQQANVQAAQNASTPAWAISTTTDNPRNPTPEEAAALEVIHGSRLTPDGWRQPLTWQNGEWQAVALPQLDTGLLADIAQTGQAVRQAAAETLLHAGVDERFITYDGSDPPRPTSEQWTADGRPEWYTGAVYWPDGRGQKIRYHATVDGAQWEFFGDALATEVALAQTADKLRERQAVNVADYLEGRTYTEAVRAAVVEMLARGQTRLDYPPGDFLHTETIEVDGFDLHLHGAGGADFTYGTLGGTRITAAPGVTNMFVLRGRPYQEPGKTADPNVRVGSFSTEGIVFEAHRNAQGVGTTNAIFRFEVKNGPLRPVVIEKMTGRGFLNAVDIAVVDGGNTGVGPITFRDCTFGGGGNMLRSRGFNGVLQCVLDNIVAEHGARVDLAYSDTDRNAPGAMGLFEVRGGLYEGQVDAIKVVGGNVQIRIIGPYMEHNTGRTLDFKATNINSSCLIEQINTEHDALNAYIEGFGWANVDTNPDKIRLRVARNGPCSRYNRVPVLPLLDTEGSMLTACAPHPLVDDDLRGVVASAYVRVPNAVGVTQTPSGQRAYHNVFGGDPAQLAVAPLAVAKGQVVVVNAYVRLASGNPELGYGLYDKDGNALDSKAALLRLGKDWALVTLVHKASVTHPFVQFAWLPGAAIPEVEADPANGIEYAPAIPRGIIDATDAVCMVLADENTPLPLSIPRVQRTHGLAKILAGATDVTVIHGLPFAPPLPPMLSYPGQFGGTGGTQDRFFVTIPAAVQTDTYISWSAEPYS